MFSVAVQLIGLLQASEFGETELGQASSARLISLTSFGKLHGRLGIRLWPWLGRFPLEHLMGNSRWHNRRRDQRRDPTCPRLEPNRRHHKSSCSHRLISSRNISSHIRFHSRTLCEHSQSRCRWSPETDRSIRIQTAKRFLQLRNSTNIGLYTLSSYQILQELWIKPALGLSQMPNLRS